MRSTSVPYPVLTDDVVTVRRRRESDVAVIAAAALDPDTVRWLDDDPPPVETPAQNVARIEEAFRTGHAAPLVIADAHIDAPLGLINVQFRTDALATIAYSVFPAGRGRGVAGRAVRLVSEWAFGALQIVELRLEIDPDNLASVRVAEKLGWRPLANRTEEGKRVFACSAHPSDSAT